MSNDEWMNKMEITVRPLDSADKAEWLKLWQGYLTYYEASVVEKATETTWSRLIDKKFDIHGLCAVDEAGKLLGLVHYLYHPVTSSVSPRCYLEDLFTSKEARGNGVGRALIEAVYAAADEHGADQVYWLTQDFNETARALYDKVATKTPFIKYVR
jgi:GNAT superfamily N-acetyltransferase